MRVGIYFNARRNQGGLYQYAASLVASLAEHGRRHEYVLFLATPDLPPSEPPAHWTVVQLGDFALRWRRLVEAALLSAARLRAPPAWLRIPPFPEMAAARLDRMLFVKPSIQAAHWPYPSVFPIHDMQHRLQPCFPEVSARGEDRRRDFVFGRSLQAATVLADSEVGREDILASYPVPSQRVYALPHLAPPYLSRYLGVENLERVRAQYRPPDDFLLYPAAFWKHKNHETLLRAVALVRRAHGVEMPLLLAGSRTREYPRVVQLARELGLEQVRFLGYLPDEDLYPLYRLARALVMPTFFGPSNLPNIEAWAVGCPLITSDIRGLREQVGDAGVLADPRRPESFAEAIWRVCSSPGLREELIARGRERIARWTPRHFAERLEEILEVSGRAALGVSAPAR